MSTPPELVIFDLGNVLIRIDFDATVDHWARSSGVTAEHIRKRFIFDHVYQQFERGEISELQFYQHVKSQLEIDISFEEFDLGWNALLAGEIVEATRHLEKLKRQARLAIYSNTNISHHRVFSERYRQMLSHFDTLFISSEMGMRKPETRGFEYVLQSSKVKPEAALFFDDLEDNIVGAASVGLPAIHVKGPLSVEMALKEHNLI